MISIKKATVKDYNTIVQIGNISVGEAHKGGASTEDMDAYLAKNYNNEAITKELTDFNNIYHIISYNNTPVGFSKIIFNATHPNIAAQNVTKLDRIYLLQEFQGLKLGMKLLNFNIEFSRKNNQMGMWLYTWIENKKAIDFYLKAGFSIIGSHHFYVTETYYNLNHQMFLNFLQFQNPKDD